MINPAHGVETLNIWGKKIISLSVTHVNILSEIL